MVIVSLLFVYLYKQKKSRYWAILSIFPPTIVAGFRYDVGTDYMFRYLPDFIYMKEGAHGISNLEPGMEVIIRTVLIFTNNFQVLLLLCALIIYGLIYYNIIKYSKQIYLSIIIFYIGMFYFDSLNIMRQYMAVAFLICAFMSLQNNQNKRWVLYIGIATMFHYMSIVFVITIIPKFLKYSIKYIGIALGLLILLTPFIKPISQILLKGTKFGVYFESGFQQFTTGDLQLIMLIVNLVILAVYVYIVRGNKKLLESSEMMMYLIMQIGATYICMFTGIMYVVFRFVYLFSIFQIWGVPLFLEKVEDDKWKRYLMIVCIGIYVVSFIYLVLLCNNNEVLPYQFRLVVTKIYD